MTHLTFKDFLRILDEDLSSDVMKLQADLSMIDTLIQTRTNPLLQQKIRLQKMLAIKQKQQQAEEKSSPTKPEAQQQQQQQTGSQTTTPGSTGASMAGH